MGKLLKERYKEKYKWREDEEEDVNSHWMVLGKRQVTALDRAVWRTGFGRGCEPVVRQSAEWMMNDGW